MSTMIPTKGSRSRATGYWLRQSHVPSRSTGYWLGQSSQLRPAPRRRARMNTGGLAAAVAAGLLLLLAGLVQGGL